MKSYIPLMLRYFDGDLTRQEADELNHLIASSPDAAKVLARLAMDQANFGPVLGRLSARNKAAAAADKEGASTVNDLKFALEHIPAQVEADELLQYLLRLERTATPIAITPNESKPQTVTDVLDVDSLSAKQVVDLLPYMLLVFARTRAAKWVGGLAAAAAIVLLAAAIWLPMVGDDAPATALNGEQQHEQPNIYATIPVATLSAEHDAVWDRRPGEDLYAGQRFELTHGLAEVTTVRGAVAVVQAPATIELLASPNALYLHQGKLVGHCKTQASKGFVVKTEQGDIIDLGTEFGVGVDPAGQVKVRVFTGLVEVAADADPGNRQAMAAGDLARIDSGRMARVGFDAGFDFQRDASGRAMMPQLTDQVRWLSSPPVSVFEYEFVDADHAYLFLEKENARIPAGTTLCADQPLQPLQRSRNNAPIVLENDVQADVYFLHYDAAKKSALDNRTLVGEGRVQGKIVFDRPIVGVISSYLRLRATQEIAADAGVKYGFKPQRGLDVGEAEIGADGRTLIFNLSSDPKDLDQMRILVAPKDDGPKSLENN